MTCTILSAGEELQTCCWNEHEPPLLTVRSKVFTLIQDLCAEGCRHFYMNCEYGAPLWAAEFITELKKYNPIQLHIVVPFEEQTTNWPEDFRNRYFEVHRTADSVELISAQFQEKCYNYADKRMIDKSDVLIICGVAGALTDAAEYARERGIRVSYCPIV